MIVQLNIETPPGYSTMRLTQMLTDRLWASTVKMRVDTAQYDGPAGPGYAGPEAKAFWEARVYVAWVETAFPLDAVMSTIAKLAAEIDQDCIAAKVNGAGMLLGPRAERWLPFNPAYFKDY